MERQRSSGKIQKVQDKLLCKMVRKVWLQIQKASREDDDDDEKLDLVIEPTPDGSGGEQGGDWYHESMFVDEDGDLAHGFIDADQGSNESHHQADNNQRKRRTRRQWVPWRVRKKWAPKRKVKVRSKTKHSERREVEIPDDWVDATLVCLYKGKGSRKDPAKHRGISLISIVEKIISIIILNRMKVPVNERLMQGQNGFRALKSCRDAVFQLWRELENSNKANESFILAFIDYSKAFDSLDWERLWEILEFAGCPKELVNMIRSLYEKSTISIRITGDGELAERFSQKRGIRQGSSLSPCLFVLAMDFCLRVFQEACIEMGLPSHEKTWTAYADDIADKSMTEKEASEALQQLEAASAFVGLRLNVPKTEVMAKGITKAEVVKTKDKPVTKERVVVSYDNAVFEGWKIEARSASLIGINGDMKNKSKKSMKTPIAIMFDDGDHIFANDSGGGWICDEDGDNHRIKKLGFEQVADKELQKKN
jgi:hypothetical protein